MTVAIRLPDPHDHVVGFYEGDDDLVADVVEHLAAGLRADATAVVVGTPSHVLTIGEALRVEGIDVVALAAAGRYASADAAELLSRFMVDGRPDPERFRSSVGSLVSLVGQDGTPVLIFGEMVVLLWQEGDVTSAIELEALWNDLRVEHRFSLHCGYSVSSVAAVHSLTHARQVCRQHSRVVTAPSYRGTPDPAAHEPTDERRRFFVPVPLALRAVRRFVREALEDWDEPALVHDAELVTSELVTNALLHAASPFRVSVAHTPSHVTINVQDGDLVWPEPRAAAVEASSGRGLAIIEAIASRWGTDRLPGGKTVWVELPTT